MTSLHSYRERKQAADLLGELELVEETDPDVKPKPIDIDLPDGEGGPFELPYDEAIVTAFEHRRDLRIAKARVFDAQRQVVVRPEWQLVGPDGRSI